jgi:Flp pilus assembly protein TadB
LVEVFVLVCVLVFVQVFVLVCVLVDVLVFVLVYVLVCAVFVLKNKRYLKTQNSSTTGLGAYSFMICNLYTYLVV